MSAPKKHAKAASRPGPAREPATSPVRAALGAGIYASLLEVAKSGGSLVLDAPECRHVLEVLSKGITPPCVCAALGRARCLPCRIAGMERDLTVLRAFEEGQWSIQEQLGNSMPSEVFTGALVALNGLLRVSEQRRERERADDKVQGGATSATD